MTEIKNCAPTAMEILRTPRLTLRCVQDTDAEATSRLMTPGISQRLAFWPTPFSSAMALAVIADMRGQAQRGLAAPYAILLQKRRELVGWVVLSRDPQADDRATLGYWIGEPYQGEGYAREAVAAAMAAGFSRFGAKVIEAAGQKDNSRSFAVMAACGMRRTGERLVYAEARARHEPCDVYEARKDDADTRPAASA